MRASVITSALVLYPFVVHGCILLGRAELAVLYLSIILAGFALERVTGRVRLLAIILMPVIIVTVLYYEPVTRGALYIFPVLVCLVFFNVFARTLLTGRVPLITRMAEITQGKLTQEANRYTRSLTKVWALVFLSLALESVLLAIYAPFEIWSLFTNVINYVILACVFLGDFLVRRRLLENWRNASLRHFIESVSKVKIRDFK